MSKKTNTVLFILGGTVFNILITITCFLLLLVIFMKFFQPMLPEAAADWAMPVIFIASIVISFLVYRLVVKIIMKKVDMDKYFSPIFGRKPHKY